MARKVKVSDIVGAVASQIDLTGAEKLAVFGDSQAAGILTKLISTSPYKLFEGGYSGFPPSYIYDRMNEHPETRSWNHIIWAGQNKETDVSILPYQKIADMVGLLNHRRFLIISLMTGDGSGVGTAEYTRVTTINAYLKATYPNNFCDLRPYMIANGLALAGITPTTQDNIDIANNTVPTSLRIDGIHLNSAGNTVATAKVLSDLAQVNSYYAKFVTISSISKILADAYGINYNNRSAGNLNQSGGVRMSPSYTAQNDGETYVGLDVDPKMNYNGKNDVNVLAARLNGKLEFLEQLNMSLFRDGTRRTLFFADENATEFNSFYTSSALAFKTGGLLGAVMYPYSRNLLISGDYQADVPSAKLNVASTTQGSLPFPRLTAAQRTAISSPAIGLHVYQTDGTEGVYVYKSAGWAFAY